MANRIIGTDGADSLTGTGGSDIMKLLGGDDYGSGGDGNDTIYGGKGADTLWGNGGNNVLDGGSGNDTLWAGEGTDVLDGRSGHDTFMANANGKTKVLLGVQDIVKAANGCDLIIVGEGHNKNLPSGSLVGNPDVSGVHGHVNLDPAAVYSVGGKMSDIHIHHNTVTIKFTGDHGTKVDITMTFNDDVTISLVGPKESVASADSFEFGHLASFEPIYVDLSSFDLPSSDVLDHHSLYSAPDIMSHDLHLAGDHFVL